MNNNFIDTINHQKTDHLPVWFMRQAGRYLPEYLKIREQAGSFLNLCKNPDLATTVTLQPIKRFPLDAAILFSDILVVPEALGMELDFIQNEGPKFNNSIRTIEDVNNLNVNLLEQNLSYVFKTITQCKQELVHNIPLIGFCGSPFTLACYMIEGGSSSNYINTKRMIYNHPDIFNLLLEKLTTSCINYLTQQIKSGVDAVMIFDSWGGVLTQDAYLKFSLAYIKKIITTLKNNSHIKQTPSIVFSKGAGTCLPYIAQSNCEVIGVDWSVSLSYARAHVSKDIILQGNLDPMVLAVGSKKEIVTEAIRILDEYFDANDSSTAGLIFNLGHGIHLSTDPDNVLLLIDTVQKYQRYNR